MILYETVLAYGSLISTSSRCNGETDVSDKYFNSTEHAVNFKISLVQFGPRHPM